MSLKRTKLLITLGCTLATVACGGSPRRATSTGDSLTELQRDSMLAKSRIPGASGVGAALRAADTTSAGIRAADSINP